MKFSRATALMGHALKSNEKTDHGAFLDGNSVKLAAAGSWNNVEKSLHEKLSRNLKRLQKASVPNPFVIAKGDAVHLVDSHLKSELLINEQTQFAAVENDPTECDPTLPDLGILACGTTKTCQPSELYKLGGFCTSGDDNDLRRQLQTAAPTTPCENPYCTCDDFDEATGSGTVRCAILENSEACSGLFVSVAADFFLTNSEPTGYKYCFVASGLVERSFCVGLTDFDSTTAVATSCYIELDGDRCTSCSFDDADIFSDWDCSNTPAYVADTTAEDEILCSCAAAEEYFPVYCGGNSTADGQGDGGVPDNGDEPDIVVDGDTDTLPDEDTGTVPDVNGNVTDGDDTGNSSGEEESSASKVCALVAALVGTVAWTVSFVMAESLN